MNNIAIDNLESHKHLGITLSSDASWKIHISNTLKKGLAENWNNAIS